MPDLGGIYLLPRIVGLQAARDLVFSARTINAAVAVRTAEDGQVVAARARSAWVRLIYKKNNIKPED